MSLRFPTAILIAALVLAAGIWASAAPASDEDVPGIPWTTLLPGFSTVKNPQPHPIQHCKVANVGCVDNEITRLRALRNRLGCNHRGVFATTYLELTKQLRRDISAGIVKRDYLSPRYLYREDAYFANVYFRITRAYQKGKPVPQAWQIAFDAARSGNVFGAQDMLLGINAHVQNDMPFVLAAQGLHMRDGRSRKPDHDAFNLTLNRAYDNVVKAIRARFDPSLDLSNPQQVPFDDMAGLEAVRGWREIVFRNAERLLNAKTRAEWNQVAASIEQYAAVNAQLIAAVNVPGYGATRDAFCAAGTAGS